MTSKNTGGTAQRRRNQSQAIRRWKGELDGADDSTGQSEVREEPVAGRYPPLPAAAGKGAESAEEAATLRAEIGLTKSWGTSPSYLRYLSASSARRSLHFCEPEALENTNVDPTDVELPPLVGKLGGVRVGVMVVVELLAAKE